MSSYIISLNFDGIIWQFYTSTKKTLECAQQHFETQISL